MRGIEPMAPSTQSVSNHPFLASNLEYPGFEGLYFWQLRLFQ
ncbi:uncharacterized protein METZ01_LOCUS291500, partial [marine metagenome]